MQVRSIFPAGVSSSVFGVNNYVVKLLYEGLHSRLCVFLGIPFGSTLIAVTGLAQVVQLLEIDLTNLFLSVCCLTEPARLRQMCDGLR